MDHWAEAETIIHWDNVCFAEFNFSPQVSDTVLVVYCRIVTYIPQSKPLLLYILLKTPLEFKTTALW